MFSNNKKISIRQLQVLLIFELLGTSVIVLPKEVAKAAGSGGVIGVFLGCLLMILAIMGYGILSKHYPRQTVVETAKLLLTKPVGIVVSCIFLIKIMVVGGLELRLFCEVIGEEILFQTPLWMVGGGLFLITLLLVSKGYECRGRLGEVLFLVAMIPLVVTLLFAVFGAEGKNVANVFASRPVGYGKAMGITFFSFYGLEFILLVFPFLRNPENAVKGIATAGLFVTVVLTGMVFLTIGVLGVSQVQGKLFPVLSMINTVEFPGVFWERQDIVILWFWMVSALISLSGTLFFCTLIGQRIFSGERKKWLLVVSLCVMVVGILPRGLSTTMVWLRWVKGYGGAVTLVFVPGLLLLLDYIKRSGKE